MDATRFLLLLVQSIIQLPHMVGYELDEDTHERMKQREQQLSREMTRLLQEMEQKTQEMAQLLQEVEQKTQEQSSFAWGALFFSALQQWQFWAIAGVVVVLFGLCWWLRKRSHQPDSSSEEESSSSDSEPLQDEGEEDNNYELNPLLLFDTYMHWPFQNPASDCMTVKDLVGNLILVFRSLLLNSLFPELQSAVGVGSAFEGWSPCEEDVIYHVLVPMKPPRWHTFHLELCDAGETMARNFRIRVEQECTCMTDHQVGDVPCFLHHPMLRKNEKHSLLDILCTGFYLDAQKTARWFHQLVRSAWVLLPQASSFHLKMLPCSRSCKFQVTKPNQERIIIEILSGVQQGDSDIFVTSQSSETIFTPSTMWPESYAVAEVKFFRHVARQAPHDTFHLKCLQLFAHILVGIDISTYTLKTVVMHLLNTLPLSSWRMSEFLMRLQDIMEYLCACLEEKRLNHFFFGNENVPEEIILPSALQKAEPRNLFQHLVQDPDARAKALHEFNELKDRLVRLLLCGH